MANLDGPKGVKVFDKSQDMMIQRFYIDGNIALAVGKSTLVKLMTDSSGDDLAVVDPLDAASDDYIGPVMAVYDSSGIEVDFLAASTKGYVDVATNPELKLIIQTDGAGTAITVASVGDETDAVFGAVDVNTGLDPIELDEDGLVGDGSTAQFMILMKVPSTDNVWGANVKLVVKAAEHALRPKITAI